LICECSHEERFIKENELIKNETDKIVLNQICAIGDKEKFKEYLRNYQQSEKRKEYLMSERAKELNRLRNKRYREKQKLKKLNNQA
jgi:hypothetical protein